MSDSRAKEDTANREKGLLRLQKRLKSGKPTKANINNRRYSKYLKLERKVNISINIDKYTADAAQDGLKSIPYRHSPNVVNLSLIKHVYS